MKYYAVRKGRKTGIFTNWKECDEQVRAYSGAEFKSFKDKGQALDYLNEEKISIEDSDILIAYVDGSYSHEKGIYGSGAVFLYNGEVIEKRKSAGKDKDLLEMRNVSGELIGALMSMEYALENGYKEIVIRYDYAGIEKWALGEWRTKKPGTKKYKYKYLDYRDKLDIHFDKVEAHSGDKYNDMADALAKESIEDFRNKRFENLILDDTLEEKVEEKFGIKLDNKELDEVEEIKLEEKAEEKLGEKEMERQVDNEIFEDIKAFKSFARINIAYKGKIIDEKTLYNLLKEEVKETDIFIKDIKEIKALYDVEEKEFIFQLGLEDGGIKNIIIDLESI